MRVISGTAKGRSLKAVPGTSTRPTTDKVKEAIFSMIGPYFDGGQVLDLFAGTGGLGIEALSRGMDKAVFIDIEKKSIDTIQHNVEIANRSEGSSGDLSDGCGESVEGVSEAGEQFELVFLDPPYRMKGIAELMSDDGGTSASLNENATIVVEHDAKDVLRETIGGFKQQRRADYGDTAVTIYKRDIA